MKPSKKFLRQGLRQYLDCVPDATPYEIAELEAWVAAGNNPSCNPAHVADEKGCEMRAFSIIRDTRPHWIGWC